MPTISAVASSDTLPSPAPSLSGLSFPSQSVSDAPSGRVRTYALLSKVGLRDRVQVVIYAYERGLR